MTAYIWLYRGAFINIYKTILNWVWLHLVAYVCIYLHMLIYELYMVLCEFHIIIYDQINSNI